MKSVAVGTVHSDKDGLTLWPMAILLCSAQQWLSRTRTAVGSRPATWSQQLLSSRHHCWSCFMLFTSHRIQLNPGFPAAGIRICCC